MPTRILRDGILSSERVARLSFGAEVFYRRIMSLADDYGRYTADLRLLRSGCFPLRVDEITTEQIGAWLQEIASREGLRPCEKPLIAVYEVNGKPFLEIQDFGQAIRATKSKYPAPDSNGKQLQATASNCEQPCTQTETKTETKADVSVYSERMYARHPRKKNKPLVEMELVSIAKRNISLDNIDTVHAAWCACEEWQRDGGRYVPSLDRWLSDEAWTQSPPRSEPVRTMPVIRTPWLEAKQ